MQVKVGEKIRLIKAMGAFTNIGEECEVTEVKPDGEISFRFGGCHMGTMSADEAEKYFEKVITNKVIHYSKNSDGKYVLIKEREGLEELNLGEIFKLDSISLGVATIISEVTDRTFYISEEILHECFAEVTEVAVGIDEGMLSVSEETVNEIMEASEFNISTVFGKCTVVACKLPNGFVITESSASVSPDNYSQEIGVEICKRKIKEKIFELEAYFLQEVLANAVMVGSEECCSEECCGECCQGDCEHCCEE